MTNSLPHAASGDGLTVRDPNRTARDGGRLTRGDGRLARAGGRGPAGAAPVTRGDRTRELGFGEAVRLVAERETIVRLQDRGFLLSTLVLVGFVVASLALPLFFEIGPERYRVATVGESAAQVAAAVADRVDQLEREAADTDLRGESQDEAGLVREVSAIPGVGAFGDFELTVTAAADVAAAEQLLRDDAVDVAIVTTVEPGTVEPGTVELVALADVPWRLSAAVAATGQDLLVRERLAGEGLSAEAVTAALAPGSVTERLLDTDADDWAVALFLGFVFVMLFSVTVFLYGYSIAQSVAEEKQSRVIELLVAAVPIRALLVGKVLGSLVLALGQLVVLFAVGLLTASAVGEGALVPLLASSGGWFVLFFVLGFGMLACLWAAAGAMANRVEDLASTTTPIQALLFLQLFVAVIATEEGPWRTVLSYVPFTAPVVMPQRLVEGAVGWPAALGAAASILLAALVLVLVAERLYRGSLLRTRGRASLRDAWASADG